MMQAENRDHHRRMAASSRSGAWLSFRDAFLDTPAEGQIRQIREGARATYLVGAAETLGVSQETVFALVGLPSSTAKRKVAKAETLDAGVTERLTRIGAIEKLAEETFGEPERARAWLQTPNLGMGNAIPLSLLDTEIGCREVARVLNAIAYGGTA